MLWETAPDNPARWVAPANFVDWRRELTDVVSSMAAFDSLSVSLTGQGAAERLRAVSASGSFFTTLGQRTAEGRPLEARDDEPSAPCVAVLAHGLRVRRFGNAPVVGTALVLDGRPCTVVGVLPQTFQFPLQARAEVWLNGDRGVPRSFPFPGDVTTVRDAHLVFVVARRRDGVALSTLEARLQAVAADLAAAYPATNAGLGAHAQTLHEAVVGGVSQGLWLLQAAVLVLLLVACVNVAHLLVGRAARRQQELAVRVSLGARRADLVRQLVGEALAYAAPGGLLGLLIAMWGLDALVAAAPSALPRQAEVGLDAATAAIAAALTLGTTLVVGLAPVLWLGTAPAAGLSSSGVRISGGRTTRRWHRGLVVGELALAQVLVVGAWMLASSLFAASRVDLGYDTAGRVAAELSLAPDRYQRPLAADALAVDPQPRRQFVEAVLTRVRASPGVVTAAAALTAPLGGAPNRGVVIVGQPEPPAGQEPVADFQAVTPGYLATLGIRLVAGRDFAATDDQRARPVALVNAAFARRYFGADSAVGREIGFGGGRRHIVVGVVGDARYRHVEQAADPAFYVPLLQNDEGWPFLAVLVRTTGRPADGVEALRAAVAAADPGQPVSSIRTLDAMVGEALAARRFNTTLMLLFGAIAMAMAAVGAYGVVAALVSARAREFSIRAALGASGRMLTTQVLGETALLAALATALGLAGALAGANAWERLLYGVTARDPWVLGAAALTVAAAALLAAWPAARRVGQTSPSAALGVEG
jgi:predicted permease